MGFHLVYSGDDDTLDLGIPLLNYGEECSLPTLLVKAAIVLAQVRLRLLSLNRKLRGPLHFGSDRAEEVVESRR